MKRKKPLPLVEKRRPLLKVYTYINVCPLETYVNDAKVFVGRPFSLNYIQEHHCTCLVTFFYQTVKLILN